MTAETVDGPAQFARRDPGRQAGRTRMKLFSMRQLDTDTLRFVNRRHERRVLPDRCLICQARSGTKIPDA